MFVDTCYSFVDSRQAMHISALYHYDAAKTSVQVQGESFLSAQHSVEDDTNADAWARQIWADVLGRMAREVGF